MKNEKKPFHSIRKPNFLGGKKAFEDFLAKSLIYPKEALENKKEGTAHIKLEISDRGKVIKAESIHKLGFGMDEEAERLSLLMTFENTEERGLKIKHSKTIRIRFGLPPTPPPEPPPVNVNYNYETKPAGEKKGTSYSY